MKDRISTAPWATKLAAVIIAFMTVANLPYVLFYSGLPPPSAKMWVFVGMSQLLNFAVAYGLLRRIAWVRAVWCGWTIYGFLMAAVPEISALTAQRPHSVWAILVTGIKMTTVALLFLPASHQFFRVTNGPNHSSEPTQGAVH